MKQVTLIALLFCSIISFGQQRVKGIISDEFGPLAGANVIVKNSNKGTATDFNGNFEIETSINDTLQVSYVVINHRML